MSDPQMSNEEAWTYAIGLVKVDGLEPTQDMLEMIEQEKCGEITTDEIIRRLDARYRTTYQMAEE
jgi:hypothetical protein